MRSINTSKSVFGKALSICTAALVLGFLVSPQEPVIAQPGESVASARVFDRISLALTGQLKFKALREEYLMGKKSIGDAVDYLVSTEEFLESASRFWLVKMKISGVTDFENIRTSDRRTVMQAMRPSSRTQESKTLQWIGVSRNQIPEGGYFRLATEFTGTLANVTNDEDLKTRIENSAKIDCQLSRREFTRNGRRICPAPYNKAPNKPGSVCVIPSVTAADIETIDEVWFGPERTKARVCPGVVERCGERLENCFPGENIAGNINADNGPYNTLIPNLRQDFTLEPGMIAAKVIQDGRPWEDVLRASDAPMSGAMEHFLASEWGSRIVENMPSGSYRKDGEPTLDKSRGLNDRKWLWRDRGPLHAGVLTTIAFQKAFNGWRAKSAASLDAFLCRVFEVPEGVAVLPSSEVDLTRRPYCQSCHSVLEPLSLFFGRWPNLGDTNYLYSAGADRVATGTFENLNNADTNGLAKVYTSTPDFHTCAVSRAFEFMVGRTMNSQEVVTLLPTLQKAYKDGGNKIKPVFKELATGQLFERSRQ